jgi:beta-galactosidase
MCLTSYGQIRRDELLNFDWKFIQSPLDNAQKFSFDDSDWKSVHLPHDASIYGPFIKDSLNSDRKNGFRPRLAGWYRKNLKIDNLQGNNLYFLHFEGVFRDAIVYINEQEVAHQLNGYEGFTVDITDKLKEGDNLLAVSYDNTYKESSRWYNGEGIYRDVWLQVRPKTFLTDNGSSITTPVITDELARIRFQVEVMNHSSEKSVVELVSEVLDFKGRKIAEYINRAPVGIDEVFVFDGEFSIEDPVLWSIESPNLYTLKNSVSISSVVIDEDRTSFGIRSVAFDPDRGFLLNGEKLLLKGVNIHHDLGPLGAAAFERGFERRLEGLKTLGCNAIRLSHNPHDEYILDWCDQNGMLVFDEAFDKWGPQFFGEESEFEDHWMASLEALIKRDRNHPSVFIWSVGNETAQQKGSAADYGVSQLKVMVDFVRNLDPSRQVTCGLHPARQSGAYRNEEYYRSGPPEMSFYMDVVSANYREEFWPVDHKNYPQLSFILSESQVGNLGNEWFNFNHDYGAGIFYWGGTDYIGESFGWPAKGWPNGIIDWNDHWKPFSYYIQSLYSDEPMVHIAVYDQNEETTKYWNEVNLRFQPMYSHWNWEGEDSVKVLTMTNTQEVELLVNGESMGRKKVPEVYYTKDIKAYTAEEYDPDNPINLGPEIHKELEWVIPYSAGKIEVIGINEGNEVTRHNLKTAGEAYSIRLVPDRKQINANGMDLSYITVEVVDKEGILVPDADHEIAFKISGKGINAGVSNADIISNELFQADVRSVFQGKALLVVRSTRKAGKIKIKAEAEGLNDAKIEILSVQNTLDRVANN